MDRPRHPGRVGRLRAALVAADQDLLRAIAAVDCPVVTQIPRLAQPLWPSQRTQSPGAARPLAGKVGEGGDRWKDYERAHDSSYSTEVDLAQRHNLPRAYASWLYDLREQFHD